MSRKADESLPSVDSVLDKLKSDGTFDQFRRTCLGHIQGEPSFRAYSEHLEVVSRRYLHNYKWKESSTKNEVRGRLRDHALGIIVSPDIHVGTPLIDIVEKVLESKAKELLPKITEAVDFLSDKKARQFKEAQKERDLAPAPILSPNHTTGANSSEFDLSQVIDLPGLNTSTKSQAGRKDSGGKKEGPGGKAKPKGGSEVPKDAKAVNKMKSTPGGKSAKTKSEQPKQEVVPKEKPRYRIPKKSRENVDKEQEGSKSEDPPPSTGSSNKEIVCQSEEDGNTSKKDKKSLSLSEDLCASRDKEESRPSKKSVPEDHHQLQQCAGRDKEGSKSSRKNPPEDHQMCTNRDIEGHTDESKPVRDIEGHTEESKPVRRRSARIASLTDSKTSSDNEGEENEPETRKRAKPSGQRSKKKRARVSEEPVSDEGSGYESEESDQASEVEEPPQTRSSKKTNVRGSGRRKPVKPTPAMSRVSASPPAVVVTRYNRSVKPNRKYFDDSVDVEDTQSPMEESPHQDEEVRDVRQNPLDPLRSLDTGDMEVKDDALVTEREEPVYEMITPKPPPLKVRKAVLKGLRSRKKTNTRVNFFCHR